MFYVKRLIGLAVLIIIGILPLEGNAKIVGLFDFDGTIVNDRGLGATWITPWILKKVETLHTTFQQSSDDSITIALSKPEHIAYYNDRNKVNLSETFPVNVKLRLPHQIHISFSEFHRFQTLWAKAEASIGSVVPVLLDFDPIFPDRERLIVPGYYRIFDLTFKYYRESTESRSGNYLVHDLRRALERTTYYSATHTWRGIAYPLLQSLMSHPDSSKNVHIFTSRGQSAQEYRAFWRQLISAGEIPAHQSRNTQWPKLHALGRPESRIYGRTLTEKKVEVVRGVLNSLYASPSKKHLEPDGKGGLYLTHTLLVAEDDPHYLEEIANYLKQMSGGYFANKVKVVLLNTGSDEEVAAARFPYRWTVFLPGRKARPASDEEIMNWLDPRWVKRTLDEGCEESLK